MPVITRAAALLLQSTGGAAGSALPSTTDQSSTQSKSPLVNITTTKNRSKKKKQQPSSEQTTTPIVIQAQQPVSNLTEASRSISPTSPASDLPIVLHMSSASSLDDTYNDTSPGDANAILNAPVVEGDVTTGTSQRGGRMIFMSGFSYLYMSEAKETIGWRCSQRDKHCKAVSHTSKGNW